MSEQPLLLMGDENVVYIIIAILYFVGQLVSAFLKRKQAGDAGQPVDTAVDPLEALQQLLAKGQSAPAPEPVPTVAQEARSEDVAAHLLQRHAAATTQAETLIATLKLRRELFHFSLPLEQHLLPALSALGKRIKGHSHRGAPGLSQIAVEGIEGELGAHVQAVLGFGRLAKQREHPRLAAILADADRIAASCFEPLRQFADAHLDAAPIHHVLCTLGSKSLSMSDRFAPASTALIYLPREFLSDVMWWPAIAHEIGHLVYWNFPGFRREVLQLTGGEPAQNLYWMKQQLTTNHLANLFARWSEELLCDIVGALMLGPAFMLAQTAHFRRERVREVALIGLDQRQYDHHPPYHLRVYATYRTLIAAGFNEQVTPLWTGWLSAHGGEIPELLLPVMEGGYVAVPSHYFLEQLEGFVTAVYRQQFRSLAGHQLISVPGLGFSLAEHFNATRDLKMLEQGADLRKYDAREMLAAVVYLASDGHAHQSLMSSLRNAVIGIGSGEHISTPVHELVAHQLFTPAVVRDAVILYETLRSRRSGRL